MQAGLLCNRHCMRCWCMLPRAMPPIITDPAHGAAKLIVQHVCHGAYVACAPVGLQPLCRTVSVCVYLCRPLCWGTHVAAPLGAPGSAVGLGLQSPSVKMQGPAMAAPTMQATSRAAKEMRDIMMLRLKGYLHGKGQHRGAVGQCCTCTPSANSCTGRCCQ
jgi:hypothetical protein